MKVWQKSGLSEKEFLELIYQAREITLQHSGSIRKSTENGRGTKNRAPYFFGVLQNLVDEKKKQKVEELRREFLSKTRVMPR